jgi:hypothetical protein
MGTLGVHVNAPLGEGGEVERAYFEEGRLRPLQVAATVPAASVVHGIDVYLSTG